MWVVPRELQHGLQQSHPLTSSTSPDSASSPASAGSTSALTWRSTVGYAFWVTWSANPSASAASSTYVEESETHGDRVTALRVRHGWTLWRRRRWHQHLFSLMGFSDATSVRTAVEWMCCTAGIPAQTSPQQAAERVLTAVRGDWPESSFDRLRKSSPASSSLRTSEGMSAGAWTLFSMSYDDWAIALGRDCLARRKSAQRRDESGCSFLAWPTTDSSVANDAGDPQATEARRAKLKAKHVNGNGAGATLANQTRLWSTITVADATGGRTCRGQGRQDELMINGEAQSFRCMRRHQTTPAGPSCCDDDPTSHQLYRYLLVIWTQGLRRVLKLNPRFAEWLMGWPIDWTGSGPSETEWSRYRQRMRSSLSQLMNSGDSDPC